MSHHMNWIIRRARSPFAINAAFKLLSTLAHTSSFGFVIRHLLMSPSALDITDPARYSGETGWFPDCTP